MGLMTEPWGFANYVDNLPSTPALAHGTVVTPGTSNADGTPATILSALAFDVHYIILGIAGMTVSAAAEYTLVDLLIDPAGGTAWRSIIDDLVGGFSSAPTTLIPTQLLYYIPLYIKAGTSVGAMARTSHTVAPALPVVLVYAFGNPSRPDAWWCGQGVETLGVTAASSIGTSVTPGNTGAFGNWTTIGTTTARYGALLFGTNGTDSNAASNSYYFQVGTDNVQIAGVPTFSTRVGAAENTLPAFMPGPYWVDIPQGKVLQVRGTASGTAEIWAGGVALYGVY